MTRPDQEHFDKFTLPLEGNDHIWEKYGQQFDFTLEKNPYRKPGRLLRNGSIKFNSKLIYTVELYLEPIWFEVEYSDILPYTFAVCAYYNHIINEQFYWKIAEELAINCPLSSIHKQLSSYLDQAFALINIWTPEYIISRGIKQTNLYQNLYINP
jgi:hypothetical protein